MIRKRPTPARPRRAAPSPSPAAADRAVCRALRTHMAKLGSDGWRLHWPVVRNGRRGDGNELTVRSPYFFLNERIGKRFKQTGEARAIRPSRASDLSDFGGGEQFAVAMRHPERKVVDVLLYADGLLMLYRDAMSRKGTSECLAARPLEPTALAGFADRAVEAAKSHIQPYLFRAREPSAIQAQRDITSRRDVAKLLSEKILHAGGNPSTLNAEVERIADGLETAHQINQAGCIQQLDYLLRMVGEETTRAIVRRCVGGAGVGLSAAV